MSGYYACLLALFAIAGALCGAFAVPKLADAALKRAYRRNLAWWKSSFADFVAYREKHPDELPLPSEKGADGACGIWLADALSLAHQGSLARERAAQLADAGLKVDPTAAERTESEQSKRCSFKATALQRVLLGLACAAVFAMLPGLGVSHALEALVACCVLAMLVAVACDLRARMIPIECCLAIAIAGGTFQLLHGGLRAFCVGMGAAVVVIIVCWVAKRVLKARGRAVGGGDIRCMAALSLATGPGALAGATACYLAAAGFSIAGLAMRKLRFEDGLPMAPFLALWLVFGGMVIV